MPFADPQVRNTFVPAGAALMAVVAAAAMTVAAPAYADTSATVKARTQRMSAPNLRSGQDGWYNPGDNVSLVCSKRGQKVRGFFSFNIPGGFDDLWYRTGDGHFVADVDIETGTLDVVAPDCGNGDPGTAPAPPSSKADAAVAVAVANGMVDTDAFGDIGCGKFVAAAYGVPGIGYDTALQFRNALADQGKIHMDQNPPKGALVFSQSKWDLIDGQHYGHVVIARGDGSYVSGGVSKSYGSKHNVQVLPSWNPAGGATYLGWADAPW